MTAATPERLAFRALPLATLAIAATGIAWLAGSAWPWHAVVHEDGQRTLLQTVFYFEHAARELPPDLLLAMAVAGAMRHFHPRDHTGWPGGATARQTVVVVAVLVVILGGTWWTAGGRAVLDNLSQLHTRPGAALEWGAHWRYHLIERAVLVLTAFTTAACLRYVRGGDLRAPAAKRPGLYAVTLLLFLALTLVFRPTTEPFTDARFLGHQARELMTHGLVTFPLAIGACLGLATSPASRSSGDTRRARPPWLVWTSALLALAGGAFLLVASLATGATAQGQSSDLARLVFPHFAEHSLGYLLVPAVAALLYAWPSARRAPGSGTGG